jgi:hypothetical protein
MKALHRSRTLINPVLIAAGLAAAVAAPAFAGIDSISRTAGPIAGTKTDAESVAHAQWRDALKQNPAPSEGCFHAAYPNIVWERVQCRTDEPRFHPVHAARSSDDPEVTGNGNDYVAYAKGLILWAEGNATIVGTTSEESVGVAAFGGGGILGPNEYSLQMNTNDRMSTAACAGHSGCTVWQQFVYATDYFISPAHTAGLFMQYWLLNYGSCPTGWYQDGNDCYKNSAVVEVPDYTINELDQLALAANVTGAGGTDLLQLYVGEDAYSVNGKDSVLDISEIWNKVEFNVFGDAGGSEAVFASGTSMQVSIGL